MQIRALVPGLSQILRSRSRRRITPSRWASEHMRTERGRPLDLAGAYRHMVVPLDDLHARGGMMCGSQVGKTTVAISRVYWFADTNVVRIIYTMHTDSAVLDFSATRAKPAIDASPHLSEVMSGINNVHTKTFQKPIGRAVGDPLSRGAGGHAGAVGAGGYGRA